MGDPSSTYGTYIWWAYLLEENDMKWDPFLEINMFLIIKDMSYISSKIQVLLIFRDRDNLILPSCCHLLYPQQIPLGFDHLMGKYKGPLPMFLNPITYGGCWLSTYD